MVALVRVRGGVGEVLDYLNYGGVPVDGSYGSVPDGQPFERQVMYYATAGGTNNGSAAPLQVYINEWMAWNTRTLPNPVGGAYDDWFELYNPNGTGVDLHNWSLANSLTNAGQYGVPNGYSIPAGGYLLVWADGKPERNSTNSPDLHVNFKLDRDGEAIALFGPEGHLVDGVVFGPQTSDVSQGRFPDGTTNVYSLTTATPRGSNIYVPPAPWITSIVVEDQANVAAPVFTMAQASNGNFNMAFTATTGLVYQVDYKDEPHGTGWTPLGSPVTATNSSVTVHDAIGVNPQRFYRAGNLPVYRVTVTFTTTPGLVYQLESRETMEGGTWVAVAPAQRATGTSLSVTDPAGGPARRFYRVVGQ